MVRVLFTGGRNFADEASVRRAFDKAKPTFVITGGADGADRLCKLEAKRRGIPQVIYPANWEGEGRAAGHIRNARMLIEGMPDLVVAFPGGAGTEGMVTRAEGAGVPVRRIQL